MRRGQSWTVDYTIGLVLFLISVGITTGLVLELFDDNDYDHTIREAERLANIIISDGYPHYWHEDDVVRPGILSDGRFSLRKAEILARMSQEELRALTPTTKEYALTIKQQNETIAIRDDCSIGTTPLPAQTIANETNHTVAYYTRGAETLKAWAQGAGATTYEEEELSALLEDAHEYGIIILEDPLLERSENETITKEQLAMSIAQTTTYGQTILLIGDLSTSILGASASASDPNGTIQAHDEPYFSFEEGMNITFEQALTISAQGVLRPQAIAPGAMTWQHKDSRVYYFASAQGLYNQTPLQEKLEQGLDRAIKKQAVECTTRPEELEASELVAQERIVPGVGALYTITLYVWSHQS